MKEINWTDDQLKAIEGRKGKMTVSAAAGSGKTAVLVERVLRRLCDPSDPCDIDNLLIVTFTRAAATQMKEKISARLSELSAEQPQNKQLRLQKMKLPYASICTIDSFCAALVRENFHRLGISPDFTLLDAGRKKMLEELALNSVLDEKYKENSPEFLKLREVINTGNDDSILSAAITTLYELSIAHTFPEYWLDCLCEQYENPQPVKDTVWAKLLISRLKDTVEDALTKAENCLNLTSSDPDLQKHTEVLKEDKVILSHLAETAENGSWDDIVKAVSLAEFKPAPKNRTGDPDIRNYVKNTRNYYKDSKGTIPSLGDLFDLTEEDHRKDLEAAAPAVRTLVDTVIEYGRRLRELKDEENAYYFSDVLHMTIELLLENDNGTAVATETAEKLALNYKEILVDEYQDVSEAQDSVFRAISRNDANRFMVGDVKQSIYAFRQAMPDIFIAHKENSADYDGVHYPALVNLSSNFRSRKGITDTVNFIFSRIMSKEAGDIDYNEKEYLRYGANYPERDEPDCELHFLRCDKSEEVLKRATYIAERITRDMENGVTVTSHGETRPARYSDYCILAESVKSSAKIYAEVFEKYGIPLALSSDGGFISSPEISLLLSLISVIDNPLNDVALAAVMLSPIFGFTPDEAAIMRMGLKKEDPRAPLYRCVSVAAEKGNEKAAGLLGALESYRRISCALPIGEFISRLADETGYRAIVSAMKNGSSRLANINALIDTANKYRKNGGSGLSGFLRYIEKTAGNKDSDKGRNPKSTSADAVMLSTIHSSKGLEYPFVFLTRCESLFSEKDLIKPLIIAKKSGIGIKRAEDRLIYKTLPYKAAGFEKKKELRAEKLRLLYVALTRPKEKLIILLTDSKSAEDKLAEAAKYLDSDGRPSPFSVLQMNRFSTFILSALYTHPSLRKLTEGSGAVSIPVEECGSPILIKKADLTGEPEEISGAAIPEETAQAEPSPEIINKIKENLSFEYPYSCLRGIAAKRVASNAETAVINDEFFASSTPSFTHPYGLSPSQRGTVTHRFMQFADYARAAENPDAELDRLRERGIFSSEEAQAVNTAQIKKFFSCSLARRILEAEKAGRLYKEYEFAVNVPLSALHPEIPEEIAKDESVVIEGVADCAFIEEGRIVVVDYKTDRAGSAEELREKYYGQLDTYRKCLSEVIGLPAGETYIYSFRLGAEIKID